MDSQNNKVDLTKKSRDFCVTLNNYTEQDVALWKSVFGPICRYTCFELEVGDSGTPHIQGYVYFDNQRTWSVIKKTYGGRAHVERTRGTPADNRAYCSKDNNGTFWESGELPQQGKRKDIDIIREGISSGAITDRKQLYALAGSYQAFRFGEIGLNLFAPPRTEAPLVEWVWGPTGTGKSHYASQFKPQWVSGLADGRFFFQGYDGEPTVVMEDFRQDCLPLRQMLRVLDKYQLNVEVKGGHVNFAPTRIIITSCYKPEECFPDTGENISQLLRRISSVKYFGTKYIAENGSHVSAL